MYLIAKELAKRGNFDVCMVVWDHGQPHIECREGVTLYSWTGKADPSAETLPPTQDSDSFAAEQVCQPPLSDPDEPPRQRSRTKRWLRQKTPPKLWFSLAILYEGLRAAFSALYGGIRAAFGALYGGAREMLRAIHTCGKGLLDVTINWFDIVGNYPVLRDAVAIYDEIGADLYLVPGNHNRAAEVACFCKKRGKKYVFLAGSDMDYHPSYKAEPDKCDVYGVPGYLMVYAIEAANLHIVQSEYQAGCLSTTYGRSAIVMRNPIDPILAFPRSPSPESILWVGSADDRVRRPSMMLQLARQMPDYRFIIIMVPALPETQRRCSEMIQNLPNVTLVGRTPFRGIEKYYADARLLVNTSVFEGFPNSFLQAAKYGVPIVAVKVDPGGMLTRYGCGLTSNDDLEQLEQNVRLLMSNAELYAKISANCVQYVKEYHDKAKIIPEFENVLLNCFGDSARSGKDNR